MRNHRLPDTYAQTIQQWFIPLAEKMLSSKQPNAPLYIGVNGCQGSGKSTLSDFLACYFQDEKGLSAAVMSLDDFYFDIPTRESLAQSVHPLLRVRGVPGTHNTKLMSSVLRQLKTASHSNTDLNIRLPRFNKAHDNPHPESEWPVMQQAVDVVIMEGWCWGVRSQPICELDAAVNSLESERDAEGKWRQHVNDALKAEYEPLYELMDEWVMLQAPSFEQVFQWRCEQEHKLADSLAAKGETAANKVMSDAQVLEFIQYYQRLTEHALATLPAQCQHVFKLDGQRNIVDYHQSS